MERPFGERLSSARPPRNDAIFAIALALAVCACAGSDGGPAGAAVIQHLTSDSGAYRVDVTTDAGRAPVRGENTIVLSVADGRTGAPSTGLTVTIVPFMPAMGHGASTTPTVTESGGGKYVASGVDLFMPGLWELRTTLADSAAGTTDKVDPQFQIE